jgi:hypothetical protein
MKNYKKLCLAIIGLAVVGSFILPENSFAGQNAKEFDGALTKLTDIVQGQGGKVAGVTALLFALAGSVLRFNLAQIAGAVGVGLTAGYGVTVVTSNITALI